MNKSLKGNFNLQEYTNQSFGVYHGEILDVKLSFTPDLAEEAIGIKDEKTFDEQIYNIIKDWKRNYKPELQIFDSLYWDLKITLQDDTNYRFKGYHETPENFEVFEDFLTMLSKC